MGVLGFMGFGVWLGGDKGSGGCVFRVKGGWLGGVGFTCLVFVSFRGVGCWR